MALEAELIERGQTSVVAFHWRGGYSFSQVMEHAGRIPIPPYLKRDTEAIDLERYQTWYAKREGSVAAPTAGLHFTQRELDALDAKGIKRMNLCLHVGAVCVVVYDMLRAENEILSERVILRITDNTDNI